MLSNIKNKYKDMVWGYQPAEFFPVLYEGKLQNKNEFLAYKLKCFAQWRTF